MEEVKNETKQTKTQVFNVVILDKSGSMEGTGEVCRYTRPLYISAYLLRL